MSVDRAVTVGFSIPATMRDAIEAFARDRGMSISMLARIVFRTVFNNPDLILPAVEAVELATAQTRIERLQQAEARSARAQQQHAARIDQLTQRQEAQAERLRRTKEALENAKTRRRDHDISAKEIERRFHAAKAVILARRRSEQL